MKHLYIQAPQRRPTPGRWQTASQQVGGEVKSFSLLWGVAMGGEVSAKVWLDVERAAVLVALTGDESIGGGEAS